MVWRIIGFSFVLSALTCFAPVLAAQESAKTSPKEVPAAQQQDQAEAKPSDTKDADQAAPQGDKDSAKIEAERDAPADLFESIDRDVESGDFYQSCSPPVG